MALRDKIWRYMRDARCCCQRAARMLRARRGVASVDEEMIARA